MPALLPFVLATNNPDKAREICEILSAVWNRPLAAYAHLAGGAPVGFVVDGPERIAATVAALAEPAQAPDVRESGSTLEENALIKARGVGQALGLPAVADDTGLEVDALGGAPGVRSARYAGEHATYEQNVAKLLDELRDVAPAARTARFATVALVWWPGGHEVAVRGEVEGDITAQPAGDEGFGYDPVFRPREGDGRTFAQMQPAEKHALSHRGRAFRALAAAVLDEQIDGHEI
jgi:XTP/dITP diphosphohydrolase